MKSVSILTIATNKYKYYAKDLIDSATSLNEKNMIFNFIILTDDDSFFNSTKVISNYVTIKTLKIEHMPYPLITLMRYHFLAQFEDLVTDDFVAYIDADMLIATNPFFDLLNLSNKKQNIFLTQHPGYFRKSKKFKLLINKPKIFFNDLVSELSMGGLGAWEKLSKSSAFVPRGNRKHYVCGGFWCGDKESIFKMIKILKQGVEKDLSKNLIAAWHDESHLNKWASSNDYILLDPSYCFSSEQRELPDGIVRIIAVNKNEKDY